MSNENLQRYDSLSIFEQVNDICSAVNFAVNVNDLLEMSLNKTMDLFGASRGSIYILEEKSHNLILRAARGMAHEEEERMIKRLGEGIVGHVAQLKKPIVVEDITRDERFEQRESKKSYKTPSFICAPLMVKDAVIGVINVSDKSSGSRFTSNDMTLLDFLSTQIALNYKRIKLYEKFKRAVQETKNLKDKLGQTSQETQHLKKQIVIQEKLATIGKLAGGIAHEFNNPLDGVMRYTNLCLDHLKDDEVVRGYLMEIKQGLNRMAKIVKNLLACSRSDFSHNVPIDFGQALEHSLSVKSGDLLYKNITIVKKVSDGIPLIPDFGIERILVNLISNAIDAISQEGEIVIAGKYESGALIIEVSDTGCGISADAIDKIFDPFWTTKDIDKGCGLGLTIIGEVVKSYKGRINVDSEVGKGTTFSVTLPVKEYVHAG